MLLQDSLDSVEHGGEFLSGCEPVLEVAKIPSQRLSGGMHQERVRRSHAPENGSNTLQYLVDSAVCEACRDQSYDFSVLQHRVIVEEFQRIRVNEFPAIVFLVQITEVFFVSFCRHFRFTEANYPADDGGKAKSPFAKGGFRGISNS